MPPEILEKSAENVTVHTRHSQKRVFDALRCFADLLSYDNKRFAQIALRRIGILSLTRPSAGEESCKAGFIFAHKAALPLSFPAV